MGHCTSGRVVLMDKMSKELIAMNTAWIDYLMLERRVLTVGYIKSAYWGRVKNKSLSDWLRDEFPNEWVRFKASKLETMENDYEFE